MSWIAEPEAAVDSFEAVLSQRPELAKLYRTYYGVPVTVVATPGSPARQTVAA